MVDSWVESMVEVTADLMDVDLVALMAVLMVA